jgi:hypothetical protein
MDRTTVVEFSNVGSTRMEVPIEAQKLLDIENAPNPPSGTEKKPG